MNENNTELTPNVTDEMLSTIRHKLHEGIKTKPDEDNIIWQLVRLEQKNRKRGKLILICAYCGEYYIWVDHKHTQGFYEHSNFKECKFGGHKILRKRTI